MKAIAADNTKPRRLDKMSRYEKWWTNERAEALAKIGVVPIGQIEFEPVVFTTQTEVRYTPDFMEVDANTGHILFVEVKASKKQRFFHYSMTRMKAVAAEFHWFVWVLAIKGKKDAEWTLEIIN